MKRRLTSDVFKTQRFGKSGEREVLDGFLKRLQINPTRLEPSEKPDFFVHLSSVKIGVEITHYHSDSGIKGGSTIRKSFEEWYNIASILKTRLQKNNLHHFYGAVFFRTNITNINKHRLVDELVQLCKNLNPTKMKCFDYTDFSSYPYLRELVEKIHMDYLDSVEDIFWWHADLKSGVLPDPINAIQKLITKKLSSAKLYDWQNAEGRWLVIAAMALNLADTGIIDGVDQLKQLAIPNQDIFDQIYYWDKFSEEIWEVYPKPRIVFEVKKNSLYVNRFPDYMANYWAM